MAITDNYDLSIVGTVGIPSNFGGFETLAEQLSKNLSRHWSILVFCSNKRYLNREIGQDSLYGVDLNYVDWDANGWQSMPYDCVSIWRAASRSNTILILGVSGAPLIPIVRLLWPKVRIVTNIDGIEWKRTKWNLVIRILLLFFEAIAVRFSHVVIVDNQGIQEHVTKTYGRATSLVAYGGDQALLDRENINSSISSETLYDSGTYYFAVCRIEPENHIEEILEAFNQTHQARLILVGNWDTSSYSKKLRIRYSGIANIQLKDPIYDQQRLRKLRASARAYIHGHSAGGTNPSLVEAMHSGLPIFAFDVNFNRYTTYNQALYWSDVAGLSFLLSKVNEHTLIRIGRQMVKIASDQYTWSSISEQYSGILFPSR